MDCSVDVEKGHEFSVLVSRILECEIVKTKFVKVCSYRLNIKSELQWLKNVNFSDTVTKS